MDAQLDEFAFIESDAARVGLTSTVPTVTRVFAGPIAALKFGDQPSEYTFLHGAGLNAHTFDPTILALGAAAISIDLPGHGKSDWRDDADYRPRAMTQAVGTAIESLTASPQHMVGQSLGALTAICVASANLSSVHSLTLVDITPGVEPSDGGAAIREFIGGQSSFESVEEIIERAIRYQIGSDPVSLRRGITLNTRVRGDGRLEWTHHLAHLADEPSTNSVFSEDRQIDYSGLWDDLDRIIDAGIKVALVRGESGMVPRRLEQQWIDRLPTSPVFTLPTGHNVQEQAPRELAEIISEFTK